MSFWPEGLAGFLRSKVRPEKKNSCPCASVWVCGQFNLCASVVRIVCLSQINLAALAVQGFLGGLENFQHLQPLFSVGLGVVAVGKAV